jgi:hypothetical protein
MAEATLTISSRNYSSWSLRGWLLCRMAGLDLAVPHHDRAVLQPRHEEGRREVEQFGPRRGVRAGQHLHREIEPGHPAQQAQDLPQKNVKCRVPGSRLGQRASGERAMAEATLTISSRNYSSPAIEFFSRKLLCKVMHPHHRGAIYTFDRLRPIQNRLACPVWHRHPSLANARTARIRPLHVSGRHCRPT